MADKSACCTTEASEDMMDAQVSRFEWYGVLLLVVAAAFLRFYALGRMDTRGDEVELLEFMQAKYQPAQYWNFTWEAFKTNRQMPLPRVSTCAIIRLFDMDDSLIAIRLPFAVIGTLTIPALFLLGLMLGYKRLAWTLAALGAINPYNIFWARFAHVYAFPMLFVTLMVAFFAAILRAVSRGEMPRRLHLVLAALSSILAAYSHMSTWPAVGLLWSILFLYVIIRRDRLPWRQVLAWVLACGGVAFLTIAPWGHLFIVALRDERASFLTPQGNPNAMFSGMWHIPLQMTWGGDLPRGMLTLALLGCGIFGGLKNANWRPVVSVFLAIAMGLFALIASTLQFSAGLFAVRYFLPLWLVLLFISAVGLLWLGETIHGILPGRERFRDIHVAVLLFVGVAALMARPIVCILTLTGNPLEYSKMSRWMDAHLPRGSVVITEGWLGPAHMWRQHMPTNVFITFTVPDEPLANYTKFRTRDVTREFFLRNPDAAFLEMSRTYHRMPGMGRWPFPLQHFKRQVGFTNEEALALREMQLGATEDFYGVDTNNIDVLLFYNLPEDILARARQEGRPVVMLFGSGWQYMKTRDFHDWRGLAASAVIELHNLTPAPIEVTVTLRGVAGNGAKQVRTDRGDQEDFHNMQLTDWTLKPILLTPGRNDIVLSDPLWGIAKVPLLIEAIAIKPEEHKPSSPGAPAPS